MSDGTDGKNASTTTTRLPDIRAEVREDGTGEISIDGVVERVRMANLAEAGAAITTRIAELAGSVGQPVPVQVRDPDGVWSLLIHADGLVDEAPGALDDQPDDAPDEPSPEPPTTTDAKPAPGRCSPRRPTRRARTGRADPAGDRVPDRPADRRARRGAGTADRGRPPGGAPVRRAARRRRATRGPAATRATTARAQEPAPAATRPGPGAPD